MDSVSMDGTAHADQPAESAERGAGPATPLATVADAVTIGGTVAPGYEGVRDAFVANFTDHGEVGAGFSLVVDGRTVVDLWGGTADPTAGIPYTDDTLQLVFSSTKGATAICANLLAQRGELDLDAPVSSYWPEFAQGAKGDVPVRWLLCHKVGLPYIDTPLDLQSLLAWEPAVEALAAMGPLWAPGTGHGYHAVTYGWLVGEIVRRATGRTVGAVLADEIAGPLGLEFWIGLPDEQQARVAPLTDRGLSPAPEPGAGAEQAGGLIALVERLLGPDSTLIRALGGSVALPLAGDGAFNRPDVMAAELPAANGVTNARSLARLYAATVGPVEGSTVGPLLTPAQLAAATEAQTTGADHVLFFDTAFGLGFMLSSPFSPYGGPRAFGHSGAGGSVGFADPDHGLGFGYVMNRMMTNLSGDPRSRGLVAAVYEAIGVEPTYV
jgi:CubicO group peptidase (beta-lactamase class C family)